MATGNERSAAPDAPSVTGDVVDDLDDDTLLPRQPTIRQLIDIPDDALNRGRWRRMPHLVWLSVRLVWTGARWRAATAAALVAIGSAGVGVQLLATNEVLQRALAVRASGGALNPLFNDLLLVGALAAAMALMTVVGNAQDSVVGELVSRHVAHEIASAASSVPMVAYEDSAFYNVLQRATQSGQIRPRLIVQACAQLIGSLLGGIGAIVALAAVEPILSAAAALAAVPQESLPSVASSP